MITYGAHSVKDSTGDIGDTVRIACTNHFLIRSQMLYQWMHKRGILDHIFSGHEVLVALLGADC